MGRWVFDAIVGGGKAKHNHYWGDSPKAMLGWLGRLVSERGITVDPFTGGGTVPAVCKMLGRRYLAFEIEPEVAEGARHRVRLTQPPLPLVMPKQAEMRLGL